MSLYENLCQLPLSSELFCQAIHPSEPIVAVGLSSGHVQAFRLPAEEEEDNAGSDDDDDDEGDTTTLSALSNGKSHIETQWRTRRHKGSCRSLGFSPDGEVLYSAGTDTLLKAFSPLTGIVTSKLLIPTHNDLPDHPTLLHALSPQTLLLATDSSALHLFDLRSSSAFGAAKPSATHRPHDDYISSLTPLKPSDASTSGFAKQWVTTGGGTLAVTDLRRGVLVKSEEQEEELLSSLSVDGFSTRAGGSGEKVVVGGGNGVITLWERGVWDDQGERVVVVPGGKAEGESLDALARVPGSREVVVGCGDGKVRIVDLTGRGVRHVLRHDEVESVIAVGYDCYGRLISGGGDVVKVWAEKEGAGGSSDSDSDSEEDSEKDSSDSEEEKPQKKRRKGGKGGAKGEGGTPNGVIGFQGMD
ncbi:hypothetical protein V499_05667 [Pseudogymnoascus sp. VKM F-103]|nr:hypothetical protein V499_05667 [Pseudogymnoascus sp. VKM F-103]